MKINKEKLEEEIKKRNITKRKHPKYPLYVLNYSPECTYSKKWNKITKKCRGLIIDNDYNIIARPFKKFFNYQELIKDNKLGTIPKNNNFIIQEKIDGSLIILFNWQNEWLISTRGSFESEQVKYTKKYLLPKYNLDKLDNNITYLLETVYPQNRIVVDYGKKESLYLLSGIETQTGKELNNKELLKICSETNFNKVSTYSFNNINDILSYMKKNKGDNQEGYVLKWENGFRIKLKYEKYCELHKIITGLNPKSIWQSLLDNTYIEYEKSIPEELFDYFNSIRLDLQKKFEQIYYDSYEYYNNIYSPEKSRKELAEQFKNYKYPNILFSILDNKDFSKNIWKILKPKMEN